MVICVFGASSDSIAPVYFSEARRLGELIAKGGHSLIFGGGNGGLMGAVARGVRSAHGSVTGVAPHFFDEPGILFPDCTDFIFTDTMHERKAIMEERCDAFIVLPGGTGTYEEFFEVFTLKQLGQLNKSIVFLNTSGYYDVLFSLLSHTEEHGFMGRKCLELYTFADSPEEAIAACAAYNGAAGSIRRLQDYGK